LRVSGSRCAETPAAFSPAPAGASPRRVPAAGADAGNACASSASTRANCCSGAQSANARPCRRRGGVDHVLQLHRVAERVLVELGHPVEQPLPAAQLVDVGRERHAAQRRR
jgi:hypothetical protein